MDVLFWLNEASRTVPGGHQTQMDQTGSALRRLGHQIVISDNPDADPGGFDVVHGLGLGLSQVQRAEQAGVPVVLSTIWWPLAYRNGWQAPFGVGKIRRQTRRFAAEAYWRWSGQDQRLPGAEARLVYPKACVLLPNGPAEARSVRKDLGVITPIQVVPNAVDEAVFSPTASARDDFILMVGRLEPHKNQLDTLRILTRQERPVVVVGFPHPDHPAYAEACRAALRPQDRIHTALPSSSLLSLYRQAAVHVLNSWFETTGLASLEAGACATPLVSTTRGFARDYFGDSIEYSDPARQATLMAAVRRAPTRDARSLSLDIRSKYTWKRAAQATEKAYLVATGNLNPRHLTQTL